MPESQRIAGIRFRNAGRIFYFHTAGMRLETGEYVVVETMRGPEIGRVVIAPDQVVVNELGREELKPILRLATESDIRRMDSLRDAATELLPEARRLAAEAGFPARVDAAEFTLDGRRLTLSFESEDRLDYREVLRRAADRFGVKVDMRQVGARDRAKLAGGYGVCGRELCCSSWLTSFPAISIRMAKDQDLPLNPQKISGLCGRLLCCLSYEDEGYREMRRSLPKLGQRCSTPTGEGRVIGVNILRRQVTLVVDGQRVEVPDRDLGLVVRWDPASKSGDPPPSISRQDAIAQGLVEETEEDRVAAAIAEAPNEAPDWMTGVPDPVREQGPGRGRLPAGGPRKQGRPQPPIQQRGPGNRVPATDRPPAGPPQQAGPGGDRTREAPRRDAPNRERPPNLPEGRVFQRATPPQAPPADAAPGTPPGEPAGEESRRRRRRRGRGPRPGGAPE